ncbi:hypothetical protein L2E82_03148 [Cichorium intybus]|uniref:Uncharacterized protein n=1 Tax=Cichorium intybus TaxID=13427 RepID=A0ACB9H400_CICIN|nr:hypothetical protein L2E82_03148 [Cichorium intybus]
MKYKRGSIVEVLTTDELPYHSWRFAQIVSYNNHNYTIRYDLYPGFTNHVKEEERVSSKFIRPCPPTVEISEYYPGDVVEVFHNLSWKMAIVSKAFNWDLFLVRIAGSYIEIKASKSELRVRQSWQNNKWVIIGNHNKKHNLKNVRDTNDSNSITSVTSSVGSCSIDNKSSGFEDIEGNDSDGESVCQVGYQQDKNIFLGKKELGAEIHRLELQAYRRTIEALHASGPLSWEKESMVTNLRMSLHISNDEHLIEIKNLISSASSIRYR